MYLQHILRSIVLGLSLISSGLIYAEQTVSLSSSDIKRIIQKATDGNLKAQTELADRYYKGNGLTQDLNQAAFWYEKLAETGVAQAQTTLALIYIRGDGIEKNNKKAIYWLNQAAEQLLPEAQYLLGVAHTEGHGVEIDLIKGLMWYEIAAALDYKHAVNAQVSLKEKMQPQDILDAEHKATQWWSRFHQ